MSSGRNGMAVWRKNKNRRYRLVKEGKASYWTPYRDIDGAIEKAGLKVQP
jgi:hypothetical protein